MKWDGLIWHYAHYMIIFGLAIWDKHCRVGQAKPGCPHFDDEADGYETTFTLTQISQLSYCIWIGPIRYISKSVCVCCLKMLAGTWDAYPSISRSLKQKVRDWKWFFFFYGSFFVLFNTLKSEIFLYNLSPLPFFYFYYTFWDKLES